MISIVLADDHSIVRAGLTAVLGAQKDVTILGAAADGLEAVQMVRELKPTVLVLDLSLPKLGGLEVARQVRSQVPGTSMVVLSMHSGDGFVLEALRAGVTGYVLKGSASEDLIEAVRKVASGGRYLSPSLNQRVIEAFIELSRKGTTDPFDTLTSREREILHLAAEGRTNPEIADTLSLSPRTAEMHRRNLMHKLGLVNQSELIRYAIRRGVLPLDTA